MHASEVYDYKINRIFLKTLGLWPYQRSYLVRMQNALFIFILTTFIMVQLLVLVTASYNFDLLLKILAYAFPNIFVTMKYCLFVVQADSVKRFLDEIQDDWSSMKDKLEMDILRKYASNLRLLTIVTMSFCYFTIIVCGTFQLQPIILDLVLPLNESRPRQLFVITEYFVSQEQYFYVILLHEFLTGYIGVTALFSTGVTFMIYICHACALFKIASHRIEYAFEKEALATRSSGKKCLLHRRIVNAIVIHQRAIEIQFFFTFFAHIEGFFTATTVLFIDNLTSEFVTMFFILIVIGVCSLSLSLFQFLRLLTLTDDINEMFISALFIFTNMIYMFIGNYGGQEITEHGIQLFRTTYNVPWYAAPLHMQKLLLFMMRKGTRNAVLTCAGIIDASLETFASMTSTAVSYFTVIYSTR